MSTQSQSSMPTIEQMIVNPVASLVVMGQALARGFSQTLSILTQLQNAFSTGGLKEAINSAKSTLFSGFAQATGQTVSATTEMAQAANEFRVGRQKANVNNRYYGEVSRNQDNNELVSGLITEKNTLISNKFGDEFTIQGASARQAVEVPESSVDVETLRNEKQTLKANYDAELASIEHEHSAFNNRAMAAKSVGQALGVFGQSALSGLANIQNQGSQVLSKNVDSINQMIQGLLSALVGLFNKTADVLAASMAYTSR